MTYEEYKAQLLATKSNSELLWLLLKHPEFKNMNDVEIERHAESFINKNGIDEDGFDIELF